MLLGGLLLYLVMRIRMGKASGAKMGKYMAKTWVEANIFWRERVLKEENKAGYQRPGCRAKMERDKLRVVHNSNVSG